MSKNKGNASTNIYTEKGRENHENIIWKSDTEPECVFMRCIGKGRIVCVKSGDVKCIHPDNKQCDAK